MKTIIFLAALICAVSCTKQTYITLDTVATPQVTGYPATFMLAGKPVTTVTLRQFQSADFYVVLKNVPAHTYYHIDLIAYVNGAPYKEKYTDLVSGAAAQDYTISVYNNFNQY